MLWFNGISRIKTLSGLTLRLRDMKWSVSKMLAYEWTKSKISTGFANWIVRNFSISGIVLMRLQKNM
jgi:hypothetical protein